MRGLESPIEPAGPRSPSRRRCAPHTIAILSLAALLALCLILPDTEKLHNFSDKLINTAGSSLESVTGYAGWRKEPATYEPPSLPNSGDQVRFPHPFFARTVLSKLKERFFRTGNDL